MHGIECFANPVLSKGDSMQTEIVNPAIRILLNELDRALHVQFGTDYVLKVLGRGHSLTGEDGVPVLEIPATEYF